MKEQKPIINGKIETGIEKEKEIVKDKEKKKAETLAESVKKNEKNIHENKANESSGIIITFTSGPIKENTVISENMASSNNHLPPETGNFAKPKKSCWKKFLEVFSLLIGIILAIINFIIGLCKKK